MRGTTLSQLRQRVSASAGVRLAMERAGDASMDIRAALTLAAVWMSFSSYVNVGLCRCHTNGGLRECKPISLRGLLEANGTFKIAANAVEHALPTCCLHVLSL